MRFGYAAAASFVASDSDHESFIFRKFNELTARNLLDMHSELVVLQEQQRSLDEAVLSSNENGYDDKLCSSMWKWEDFRANLGTHEEVKKRKGLSDEISEKLQRYRSASLYVVCDLQS